MLEYCISMALSLLLQCKTHSSLLINMLIGSPLIPQSQKLRGIWSTKLPASGVRRKSTTWMMMWKLNCRSRWGWCQWGGVADPDSALAPRDVSNMRGAKETFLNTFLNRALPAVDLRTTARDWPPWEINFQYQIRILVSLLPALLLDSQNHSLDQLMKLPVIWLLDSHESLTPHPISLDLHQVQL